MWIDTHTMTLPPSPRCVMKCESTFIPWHYHHPWNAGCDDLVLLFDLPLWRPCAAVRLAAVTTVCCCSTCRCDDRVLLMLPFVWRVCQSLVVTVLEPVILCGCYCLLETINILNSASNIPGARKPSSELRQGIVAMESEFKLCIYTNYL